MKKIIASVSLLAFVFSMFATTYMIVREEDDVIIRYKVDDIEEVVFPDSSITNGEESDFKFSVLTDSTASVDGLRYSNSNSFESFPIKILINNKVYTVTRIKEKAFMDRYEITRFKIPSTVTYIGASAFDNCSNLESIEIPANVTSIGKSAFYGCSGLTSIQLPQKITEISSSMFKGCSEIKEIDIPANVTSIGESAFYGCSELTEINIPDSVVSIEAQAFNGCKDLKNITIPFSVTTIGDSAFAKCEELEVIIDNFEGNVNIEESSFAGCKSVRYLRKPDASLMTLKFEVLSDSTAMVIQGDYSELKQVVIPDTVVIDGKEYIVTGIGDLAFNNCNKMISVKIPNSVVNIGKSAFKRCEKLKSVKLPSGIKEIKQYTFVSCFHLLSVELPSDLEIIGEGAFSNCDHLENIEIPESVVSIGSYAFSHCFELNPRLLIYDNGKKCYGWIGDKKACVNIVIPDGVEEISSEAFSYNYYIRTLRIPESVKTIEREAFSNCDSLEVIIENDVDDVHLGYGVYKNCKSLKFTIPFSFSSVTDSTVSVRSIFQYGKLPDTTLSIPSKVVTDGKEYKVTEIESKCFYDETLAALRNLDIPESVVKINISRWSNDDYYLTSVNVAPENKVYSSVDGIVYNKDTTEIIHVPHRKQGNVDLPSSVKVIRSYNFNSCQLSSVKIPENVTKIEEWAFSGSSNLNVIVDNNKANVDIANDAFTDCKSVTFLKIYDTSVIPLKYKVLSDSTAEVIFDDSYLNLNYAVVPSTTVIDDKTYSVVAVGEYAFSNCHNLDSVVISKGVNSMGDDAFCNCYDIKKIDIQSEITTLRRSVFENCHSMASFKIPGTVTLIESGAFSGCWLLTTITIPSSVVEINGFAFDYCSQLNIIIENSEENTNFDELAFYRCKSVTYKY